MSSGTALPCPLVNLGEQILCGIGRDPWLVGATAGEHGARLEDDVGGLHEEGAQVFVAAFGDFTELGAITGGFLLRDEAEQAAKSRPCLMPLPVPIAATTALQMIGPIPGT